ncbi:MAG: peptidoglycan bridge formation glycyltransferase FemA/FemB family protein [Candidatus Doudnabacteria bacterium]|nr:peptidoglycan bridge formation glycyltransferase FemA/FemB family protein [Candidatus Doudnabacteria bacterium]
MQVFEISDSKQFNSFLISREASVLQSWEWGDFQKRLGRKVWRLLLTTNTGKVLAGATVVKIPLARGKSYFYAPRGPVIANSANVEKVWQLFLDKLSDLQSFEQPIFFRVDPQVVAYPGGFALVNLGFRKIPWEIQPKDTLVLDLRLSEQQLLHGMKPKTRYNIHLAQKKGVTVEQFSEGKWAKIFWQLIKETERRDRFTSHPYTYYFNLLEGLGRSRSAKLFLAYYQKRPLAGAIISYFGNTATYLHGASADRLRNVMAPYLVQWTAMKQAKSAGLKRYDFGGIAPTHSSAVHAWSGLTRFKTGFGGQEISYIGAYDLPYSQFWYGSYQLLRHFNRLLG